MKNIKTFKLNEIIDIRRTLVVGKVLTSAGENYFFQDDDYQNMVKIGGPGPKDHPAADHKIVYNFKTLTTMFNAAGYKVKLLEYCDAGGKFHQNPWDGIDGVIFRSKKYDLRNHGEQLVFPSLIVDAIKV